MTSLSIANAHIDCMHLPCRQGRLCLPFCSPFISGCTSQKTKQGMSTKTFVIIFAFANSVIKFSMIIPFSVVSHLFILSSAM